MPDKNDSGFVDAHVHVKNPADCASVAPAGVVAVRDAGSKEGTGLKAGSARPGGLIVVSAGWALYKKGGYGSLFGVPVETEDDIQSEILRLKHAGADIIKVMASGIVSLKEPGTVTPGGFNSDELRFIAQEAAAAGLEVMAHANGEAAIIAAAEAGVRSIEHGFFITRDALDAMAKKKIHWTPTVGALSRAAAAAPVSPGVRNFIAALVNTHVEMIRHAFSIGVPLAIGTDCVLPDPGYRAAYQAELSYFEQAGIPRDTVEEIASKGGARLLRI